MKLEEPHDFYQKGKVLLTFSFLISQWPESYGCTYLSLYPKNVILLIHLIYQVIFYGWILGFFFFQNVSNQIFGYFTFVTPVEMLDLVF